VSAVERRTLVHGSVQVEMEISKPARGCPGAAKRPSVGKQSEQSAFVAPEAANDNSWSDVDASQVRTSH
jgi:hypothetical protein